jgi:histidinol-phosphate aminotransferase
VGYALCADRVLADALIRVRATFSVNHVAQAAALAALEDTEHTRALLAACAKERARLAEGFRELGCEPLPSVANFVSARLPISAEEAVRRLLRRGVLVSAIGPGRFGNYIRVTIGTTEDTDAFLGALGEALRE